MYLGRCRGQRELLIKYLLKDLTNVKLIKRREWELRSVIGVAFYSHEIFENTKQHSKYKKYIDFLNTNKMAKISAIPG